MPEDGRAMRRTTRLCLWVRSRGLALPLLAGPVVAFLLFALVAPLCAIVLTSFYKRGDAGVIIRSFSLQNYIEFLTTPAYLRILILSMFIGATVAIATLLLAYVPACLLPLNRSPHRHLLLLLIIVPFWTSFLIRTYSWVILLGSQGVVNGLLRWTNLAEAPISFSSTAGQSWWAWSTRCCLSLSYRSTRPSRASMTRSSRLREFWEH